MLGRLLIRALHFGSTLPVTQAHGDSAATGSDRKPARIDHKHGMPAAAGGGAVTREGGITTEATTTSSSEVDLLTVASLTIAAGTPVFVICGVRKAAGLAEYMQVFVRFNTTTLSLRATAGSRTSSTDIAESGIVTFQSIGRVTNYLKGAVQTIDTSEISGRAGLATDMPTAEVTQVVIRGNTQGGNVTGGVDELQIFSYATS